MAGASTVFDDVIESLFGPVIGFSNNPDMIYAEIGAYLVRSTQRRFAAQEDPKGNRWAPNSPVTLKRKAPETRILRHHGYLANSIKYSIEGGKLRVGSDLVYAAMMQYGGTKSQFPHLWGDIPARPYLGLSDADRRQIKAIFVARFGAGKAASRGARETRFGQAGRSLLSFLVRLIGG